MKITPKLKKQRFILLNTSNDAKIGKRPLEKGWTTTKNYSYDDINERNLSKFGVLCGYNSLVVVDCDNIAFQKKCMENPIFRDTFTVKTAGKGLYHFYFYVDDEKPITHRLDQFTEKGKIRVADFQGKGTQVLGPGSKIGEKTYDIVNDVDIKKVSYIDLLNVCQKMLPNIQIVDEYTKKRKENGNPDDYTEYDPVISYIKSKITMRDLLEEIGIDTGKGRNSECPWHSSENGQCLSYDDYQFHCFHCNRSGSMFDFVMEYNDCDFITAKNMLADKVGVPKKTIDKAKIMVLKEKKANMTEYIVREFMKNNRVYTTRNDLKSEMWIFSNGIYIPHGKSYIKGFCRAVLAEFYTSHITNQIIDKIITDTYVDEDDFFRQKNKDEIVVRNGILNIRTRKISPFNPDKIFFNKIPVFYDPTQNQCVRVMSFLKSTIAKEDEIKTLQEMTGYMLSDNCKYKKGFMFIGAGDNGKSVWIDVLSEFLGKENISNVSLHDLDTDQFAASGLFGKLANINADIGKGRLDETEMIKNLISGDTIYANRKFLTPIKFKNQAKLIFASNNLPETDDETDGFFTRWQIIQFPYSFKRQTEYDNLDNLKKKSGKYKIADPFIFESLITEKEMTGMLNWALDGLDRLYINKDFSLVTDIAYMRQLWRTKSSTMRAFIIDVLDITGNEDDYITATDLHIMYVQYCQKNELKVQMKKDCARILGEYPIKYKQKKIYLNRTDYEFKRIWEGVRFKK